MELELGVVVVVEACKKSGALIIDKIPTLEGPAALLMKSSKAHLARTKTSLAERRPMTWLRKWRSTSNQWSGPCGRVHSGATALCSVPNKT